MEGSGNADAGAGASVFQLFRCASFSTFAAADIRILSNDRTAFTMMRRMIRRPLILLAQAELERVCPTL